MFVYSNYL